MKTGIATVDITPPFPMPMGGFGMRLDHADGAHDPLLCTAVYLEEAGRGAWIVAADLVQLPDGEPFKQGVAEVAAQLGCPPHALFLNASHTHGGPQMNEGYGIASPAMAVHRSPKNQQLVRDYHRFLWQQIGAACGRAREGAFPGRLVYGEGTTTFPMNRRALVAGRIENAPNPDGPIDDRLRLLGIEDASGSLRALGLILAAHPTATGAQHQFTADYVGAWREAFRAKREMEITPFFLQACCGDARAAFTREGDHWRRALLSELPQMGEHLLAETMAVLDKGLQPLGPACIAGATTQVELRCRPAFTTREQCLPLLESELAWEREFAREAIRRFAKGESLPDRVSMELAWLQLTRDFALLGMGCEPLCALGRKIESAFPQIRAVALGYTNGCFGYVPDTAELRRGGYEAESYLFEPFSGPFQEGLEDSLLAALRELQERIRSATH